LQQSLVAVTGNAPFAHLLREASVANIARADSARKYSSEPGQLIETAGSNSPPRTKAAGAAASDPLQTAVHAARYADLDFASPEHGFTLGP
jgi:hypothetical protein